MSLEEGVDIHWWDNGPVKSILSIFMDLMLCSGLHMSFHINYAFVLQSFLLCQLSEESCFQNHVYAPEFGRQEKE